MVEQRHGGAGDMSPDERAIHDIVKRCEAAWNAGDGAAWASSFADDADFVGESGNRKRARRLREASRPGRLGRGSASSRCARGDGDSHCQHRPTQRADRSHVRPPDAPQPSAAGRHAPCLFVCDSHSEATSTRSWNRSRAAQFPTRRRSSLSTTVPRQLRGCLPPERKPGRLTIS